MPISCLPLSAPGSTLTRRARLCRPPAQVAVAVVVACACLLLRLDAAEAPAVEGGSAEERAAGQTWSFTPDPALPDVLILGDSISIGYTLHVRTELKGIANVFRAVFTNSQKPAHCGDTARGLETLDAWLAGRTWRVIHFIFGLHDMKYLDEKGTYVTPDKGRQVTSLKEYAANLARIVARLQLTGARLIWGSTTPVPDGSPGRVKGDEVAYHAVATKVMEAKGVAIDDLCGVISGQIATWQKPHHVHFTEEGSKVLARAVAASVRKALGGPGGP